MLVLSQNLHDGSEVCEVPFDAGVNSSSARFSATPNLGNGVAILAGQSSPSGTSLSNVNFEETMRDETVF